MWQNCAKLKDKATELNTLCNLSGICASVGEHEKAQIYYNRMMLLGKVNPTVTYFGCLSGAMIANSELANVFRKVGKSFISATEYENDRLAPFDGKYISGITIDFNW